MGQNGQGNREGVRTLGQTCAATGRLAQNLGAAAAHDDGLGVAEHGGDGGAAGATDVLVWQTAAKDGETAASERCARGSWALVQRRTRENALQERE